LPWEIRIQSGIVSYLTLNGILPIDLTQRRKGTEALMLKKDRLHDLKIKKDGSIALPSFKFKP